MQLKIKRSQREGGLVSKNVIFCLDARVEFAPDERHAITRYKLHNQVIYNSEASKRHLDRASTERDGSISGSLKSLASVALAAMKLNITIAGLERGQHIECKSLDELLGAEDAIMTACRNLTGYLDTAMTFDGREVLFDFATGEPAPVARAITPTPMLAAPAMQSAPMPAVSSPSAAMTTDSYAAERTIGTELVGADVIGDWVSTIFGKPANLVGLVGGALVVWWLVRFISG